VLSFRPFAPEDADLENFQIITRGLKERRELRFLYRNLGADKAHWRQVRPYHLACVDNHWYLFAFDVKRDAMRTFALIQPARPESCLLACEGPEAGREARPLIIIDFSLPHEIVPKQVFPVFEYQALATKPSTHYCHLPENT
jgi:hypothetical protein